MKTTCQSPVRRYSESTTQDMVTGLPTVTHDTCGYKRLFESGTTDTLVARAELHGLGRRAMQLADHPDSRSRDGHARLLQSVSPFRNHASFSDRNVMGRANRWLHWRDMCVLKEQGVVTYDLGGWYSGHSDREKLRINAFKEEFGGTPTVEFSWVVGISLVGRLVVWLAGCRSLVKRAS
jgi:hypothetical protein